MSCDSDSRPLPTYTGGLAGKNEYLTRTRVYAGSTSKESDEDTLWSQQPRVEQAQKSNPPDFGRSESGGSVHVRTDVDINSGDAHMV